MSISDVSFYLKIDGVQGNSTVDGLPGFIVLQTFQWGGSHSGSIATSNSTMMGKFSAQDFVFTMFTNVASPVLMEACSTGKQFTSAILICRTDSASGTPVEYLKVTLTQVMVSKFTTGYTQPSASNPNAVPMVTDTVQLNFGKIVSQFTPIGQTGSAGAPVQGSINLMTGKAG